MEKIWHRECVTGRRFIIKLQPGNKITSTLLEFCEAKHIPFASMVSAVGSVRAVEFKDIQTGAHLPLGHEPKALDALKDPRNVLQWHPLGVGPAREEGLGPAGPSPRRPGTGSPPGSGAAGTSPAGPRRCARRSLSGSLSGGPPWRT